jgi:hypothetical protein
VIGTQAFMQPATCGALPFTAVSMHSPAPAEVWVGGTGGQVCRYHPGGADLHSVPGVTGGISAIYASDAGVWVGTYDSRILRLDGFLETTVTGGAGITSLHGLEPDEMYASTHDQGIWERTDAGWVRAFPDNMKIYYDVRVLAPGDVWASGNQLALIRKTPNGWTSVNTNSHLGLGANEFHVLGVRGNAQELLLYGATINAQARWDGTVVRMRRGP